MCVCLLGLLNVERKICCTEPEDLEESAVRSKRK